MAAPSYDPSQAASWAQFIDLAYATFDHDNPNPTPPPFPPGWVFKGNLQVNLRLLDTYYFIGWIASGSNGTANAIVFMGTEDLEWLYDGDCWFASHPIGGKVEAGMYDMYQSLRIALPGQTQYVAFADYLAQMDVSLPTYLTGHSLGGALTTFTAAAIASLAKAPSSDNLIVYSLASPRVGDATFVAAFDPLVPNNYRIYNVRDYVPTLPAEDLGYCHVLTAQPNPPLDSWDYPVYRGWDPAKAAECYHSHAVYTYMLQSRAGQTPNPSAMGSCHVTSTKPGGIQIAHQST